VRALAPELASVIEALLEVTERDVPPHESEALLTLLGRRALLDGVGATALHRLAPLLATRLEVDAAPLGEVLFEGYAAAISEREARATGARMAETLQVLTPLEGVRLALIGGLQRPEPLEAHAEGLADLLLEGKVRVLWVHVGGLRTHRDGWSQVLGLADACRALDVEVLYSGLVPESWSRRVSPSASSSASTTGPSERRWRRRSVAPAGSCDAPPSSGSSACSAAEAYF
jgi:hypothetical protein